MSLHTGVGGEDLGFFCKDRDGSDREGRGREPMSWPYLERRDKWRDSGLKHCSNCAILFRFFPCVISFGSSGGNLVKFRDDLTCLFLA